MRTYKLNIEDYDTKLVNLRKRKSGFKIVSTLNYNTKERELKIVTNNSTLIFI